MGLRLLSLRPLALVRLVDVRPCCRPTFNTLGFAQVILPFVKYMGPAWLRRKMLDLVPLASVQRLKNITDLMHERSVEIFNERKKAALRGEESMLNQVAGGKDVMSVLRECYCPPYVAAGIVITHRLYSQG